MSLLPAVMHIGKGCFILFLFLFFLQNDRLGGASFKEVSRWLSRWNFPLPAEDACWGKTFKRKPPNSPDCGALVRQIEGNVSYWFYKSGKTLTPECGFES